MKKIGMVLCVFLFMISMTACSSLKDNYKETTKKIQTQEMLIFPGFSLCPLICGTPQKSINFLR